MTPISLLLTCDPGFDRMPCVIASIEIGRLDTRTWALAVLAVFGLIGLALFGVLYYRKRRLQGIVEEQFNGFREKAVSLMDRLDGLRQRHKTLPTTDPDFTSPMTGATLALYNQVGADLASLWERWLEVMEIWDEAQRRIRAGSGEKVKALLERGSIDELIRQTGSCEERLDRLNRAHEQAREDLKAGRDELASVRRSIDKGTRGLRPSDPRHEEIRTAETMLSQAEAMIATDPIGADDATVRARRALAAVGDRPEPRRTWRGETPSSPVLVDELATAAEQLRSAVTRLRGTDHLRLIAWAWMMVWACTFLFGLLIPLMPLAIFLLGFVIILAGAGLFWRIVASWLFGMWRLGR